MTNRMVAHARAEEVPTHRLLWALVPDPTPRQAGEQIAESVAVHQAVVAHVSLENCWTEPP
jgi:hypothetical protein